jgi:peptidoglycan hydrolase CwlO-like protein
MSFRLAEAETAVKNAQTQLQTTEREYESAEAKAKAVQSELDDLLLVLGEMEEKTVRYGQKIRSLGGEITDDEGEE